MIERTNAQGGYQLLVRPQESSRIMDNGIRRVLKI